MRRYKLIFKGRVQGVGFRYTARILANQLNLTGSVRNLYNYDVECIVQGKNNVIDEFIEKLENQRFIRVDHVEKYELKIVDDEDDFIITY